MLAEKNDIFAMLSKDIESNLAHCSVIDRLYPEGKNEPHFQAAFFIFKNNEKSLSIIREWKEECVKDNYFNVNPPELFKCCDFWGNIHLHDQPVISCILKKHKVEGIQDESSWHWIPGTLEELNNKYPIFHARNQSKQSVLNRYCLEYNEHRKCIHEGNCPDLIKVR